MQVVFMRHGLTAANQKKLYNGRTDDPLCPEGVDQAGKSGTDPAVKTLYASPMKRAVETARIKYPNAEIIICDALREMDFGDFEGRSYDELKHDSAYVNWLDSGGTLACPNGESMTDFSERVCFAFDEIVRSCIKRGEKEIHIVAHGGSLMAVLGRYGHPKRPYYEWYVDNCCGYRAQVDAWGWADTPALTGCEMFESI